MNVYDFDNTIYDGDSTLDFYKYCLLHYPKIIICLPRQVMAAFMYLLKQIDKTSFKEEFYCFLQKLQDVESIVTTFWNKNEHKIKKWYIDQHENADVVISASPYFLLKEICDRIEIKHLIASNVNPVTGKYIGMNCYGEEKARRFISEIGGTVDQFYTDSPSDLPMMKLAATSYMVNGTKIIRKQVTVIR